MSFRIIDTGVREGRANIAFDPALIELRQQDRVPDTIRFMRFPPTALIGRHQDLSREEECYGQAGNETPHGQIIPRW